MSRILEVMKDPTKESCLDNISTRNGNTLRVRIVECLITVDSLQLYHQNHQK